MFRLAPLEPAVLIFTILIAPSTAADDTVESVATAIKSVDKKLTCCEADNEYIYFHLYPSPVVKIDVDVPVGSTVEAVHYHYYLNICKHCLHYLKHKKLRQIN